MIVTTRTIPAADALTLASLPLLPPPIPVAMPFDREVARRVVGASIPSVSLRKSTNVTSTIHAPRPSREHIALGGA